MILIDWPRAATGKGRPRFVRATGRTFTPAATRNAEADLALFARDAMRGRPPLVGPVSISIHATYTPPASWSQKKRREAMGAPKITKPDIDNIAKLATDALIGIAFVDDAQIAEVTASKRYGETDRVVISVTEAKL